MTVRARMKLLLFREHITQKKKIHFFNSSKYLLCSHFLLCAKA